MKNCEVCDVEKACFICVCEEKHVCEKCLVKHALNNKNFKHRPVNVGHPLLDLMNEAKNEIENATDYIAKETIESKIKYLEDCRDRNTKIFDEKIQNLKLKLLENHEKTENPLIFSDKTKDNQANITKTNKNSNDSFESFVTSYNYSSFKNLIRKNTDNPYKTPEKSIETYKTLEKSVETQKSSKKMHRKTNSLSIPNNLPIFDTKNSICYKIIVIGESQTGKSSLLLSLLSSYKQTSYKRPLNSVSIKLKLNNQALKLDVWDLSLSKNYAFLSKSCYYNSNAAVVMFDLTKMSTFESISKRIEEIKKMISPVACVFIVGSKIDIVSNNPLQRQVSFLQGQEKAREVGAFYDEVCTNNQNHAFDLFMKIVKEVYIRNQ